MKIRNILFVTTTIISINTGIYAEQDKNISRDTSLTQFANTLNVDMTSLDVKTQENIKSRLVIIIRQSTSDGLKQIMPEAYKLIQPEELQKFESLSNEERNVQIFQILAPTMREAIKEQKTTEAHLIAEISKEISKNEQAIRDAITLLKAEIDAALVAEAFENVIEIMGRALAVRIFSQQPAQLEIQHAMIKHEQIPEDIKIIIQEGITRNDAAMAIFQKKYPELVKKVTSSATPEEEAQSVQLITQILANHENENPIEVIQGLIEKLITPRN